MQVKSSRPEGLDELLSRPANPPLRFAAFVLDLDACMLARESGEAIPLTRGEFALLRMFVARPGRVISRDALLDAFAKRRFESFDRSVDVLIGKLRRKIETDPKHPRLIVTVPGEGYRFDGLRVARPEDRRSRSADSALEARRRASAAPLHRRPALRQYRRRSGAGAFRRRGHREPDDRPVADTRRRRNRPQHSFHLQGEAGRR